MKLAQEILNLTEAGYSGYSKSNNAVSAEQRGKYPATQAAKVLSLPLKFIQDKCGWATKGEYHHTSKFYNSTDYYDTNLIGAWMGGDPDTLEEYNLGDFNGAYTDWKEEQKKAKASTKEVRYEDATVNWIEWGGTRQRPKANKMTAKATVVDTGKTMVNVIFPDGKVMKKGKSTNGFEVIDSNGDRVWWE